MADKPTPHVRVRKTTIELELDEKGLLMLARLMEDPAGYVEHYLTPKEANDTPERDNPQRR